MIFARSIQIATVAVCVATAASCASESDSPAGPSGQTCRAYMATGTEATVAGTTTVTVNVTCSFSTQTNMLTCTYTSPTAGLCQTEINAYPSAVAFVDEVSVSPPLVRRTTDITTNSSVCGAPSVTTTYSYDAQNHLLTARDAATGSTTTYSAWDAAGRPLAGTNAGPPSANYTLVHNASTRQTVTTSTVSNGVVITTTQTYDTNGTQTGSNVTVTGVAGSNVTTSTTVLTTAQTCK